MDNIKLNVGGIIFETTKSTLSLSLFFEKALSDTWKKDEVLFVDRSPKIFEHVLCLMRDVKYEYPKKYLSELDFYQITILPRNIECEYANILEGLKKLKDKIDLIESDTLYISREMRSNREEIKRSEYNDTICIVRGCMEACTRGKSKTISVYCPKHDNIYHKMYDGRPFSNWRDAETCARKFYRAAEKKE